MSLARLLIVLGLSLVVIGVVIHYAGRVPFLSWVGRLPGDVRIEGERTRFYFPITTCIVLSLALTVLIRLLRLILPRL